MSTTMTIPTALAKVLAASMDTTTSRYRLDRVNVTARHIAVCDGRTGISVRLNHDLEPGLYSLEGRRLVKDAGCTGIFPSMRQFVPKCSRRESRSWPQDPALSLYAICIKHQLALPLVRKGQVLLKLVSAAHAFAVQWTEDPGRPILVKARNTTWRAWAVCMPCAEA